MEGGRREGGERWGREGERRDGGVGVEGELICDLQMFSKFYSCI